VYSMEDLYGLSLKVEGVRLPTSPHTLEGSVCGSSSGACTLQEGELGFRVWGLGLRV
jgi:hypothetical protein